MRFSGGLRDHSLRYGYRQIRRALCDALLVAQVNGGVLPGGGEGRARRGTGQMHPVLLLSRRDQAATHGAR